MIATIHPGKLQGRIQAPPSKSMQQRACALAWLHKEDVTLINVGNSADELAALSLLEQLGCTLSKQEEALTIHRACQLAIPRTLDVQESGLLLRMMTPILSMAPQRILVNGKGTLLKRNMQHFFASLRQQGVSIKANNEFLPFELQGPLHIQKQMHLDASDSSQMLTGLLMAIAYQANDLVDLRVTNLVSKPYIDVTLELMRIFGYKVEHENYDRFLIHPKSLQAEKKTIHIEGDWSSASILLVAGAIAGEISLTGLNLQSCQADRKIIDLLHKAHAALKVSDEMIHIASLPQGSLNSFEFDATDCPDLFPATVLLALHADGISKISGVNRLIHKESNRKESILDTFGTMGANINVDGDVMWVVPSTHLKGAELSSFQDHRIVMAATMAALNADGPVVIKDAEAVHKSYPHFFSDIKSLGAFVHLSNH